MQAIRVVVLIFLLMVLPFCGKNPNGPENHAVMKLAFTRDNEIWLYDLLAGPLENLIALNKPVWTNEQGFTYYRYWADSPRWSPDGKELLFTEAIGTDDANLKILNLATGKQRFFSNFVYRQDADPEWSADGSKIIFSKSIAKLGLNYEIFMVDADGTNETQLSDRPFHHDAAPSLHPNGIDILFNSNDNRITDFPKIYHTTVTSDSVAKLTYGDKTALLPKFNSKTGEIIYGQKRTEGEKPSIWKVSNLEFSDPIQLTFNNLPTGDWSWSNDGKLIVFRRFAGGSDGPYTNPEIWMMNADGSEQKLVIKNGTSPSIWVKE